MRKKLFKFHGRDTKSDFGCFEVIVRAYDVEDATNVVQTHLVNMGRFSGPNMVVAVLDRNWVPGPSVIYSNLEKRKT
jgi:hypothetical protein